MKARHAIESVLRGTDPRRVLDEASFSHPGDIAVDRALAVYHAMHNQASVHDWDIIDRWVHEKGLEKVLDDIERVLAFNGVPPAQRTKERAWWKKEISKPGDN